LTQPGQVHPLCSSFDLAEGGLIGKAYFSNWLNFFENALRNRQPNFIPSGE
jgi:hypothetical protein